jgi:8-oxo-dGTP pyrophosphatase MutT (NUDIX family)
MYKIYINDKPLILAGQEELPGARSLFPGCLAGRYSGQIKTLLHYVDLLEKTRNPKAVVLYASDLRQLMRDFFSLFRYLEAAGGLVLNTRGEALLIFRMGKWDLPKGKIDPGETPPQTALREVREETGLQELTIRKSLGETLHTYRLKGQRVLKRTYWYLMDTPDMELTPQTEEAIERAEWVDLPAFLAQGPDCYQSILDVTAVFLDSK